MSDPTYVRAFKTYLAEEPNRDDVAEMEREFYGESDRAVAVLQGAALDIALESAIRRSLRSDLTDEEANGLLGFDKPIGSFSAKIHMGYALSLFGRKTRHDLEIIRPLRNAFAHERKPLRFSIPAISGMCTNLWLPDIATLVKYPRDMLETTNGKRSKPDMRDPRQRYLTSCYTIAATLFMASLTNGRPTFPMATLP